MRIFTHPKHITLQISAKGLEALKLHLTIIDGAIINNERRVGYILSQGYGWYRLVGKSILNIVPLLLKVQEMFIRFDKMPTEADGRPSAAICTSRGVSYYVLASTISRDNDAKPRERLTLKDLQRTSNKVVSPPYVEPRIPTEGKGKPKQNKKTKRYPMSSGRGRSNPTPRPNQPSEDALQNLVNLFGGKNATRR